MAKKKQKEERAGQKIPENVRGLRAEVREQPIVETLEQNFMPYAMSAIVSRAIPEIDGFKPSHRTLLYTMYKEVLTAIAEQTGAFVNCFSPFAFLIVYPGQEPNAQAVRGALKISHAISEDFKDQFAKMNGLEFAMGLDHGHIMGTKNLSDNGFEHISWYGTCIYKAMRICKECARPFYVGLSGGIYHSLSEDLRITQRRILGIKKNVEMWTKVTYQYENVKKHLYQTNHKISPEEA